MCHRQFKTPKCPVQCSVFHVMEPSRMPTSSLFCWSGCQNTCSSHVSVWITLRLVEQRGCRHKGKKRLNFCSEAGCHHPVRWCVGPTCESPIPLYDFVAFTHYCILHPSVRMRRVPPPAYRREHFDNEVPQLSVPPAKNYRCINSHISSWHVPLKMIYCFLLRCRYEGKIAATVNFQRCEIML